MPGPTACLCCGSTWLAKLGEDVTETLELVPRAWKVVQHVREKIVVAQQAAGTAVGCELRQA